MLNMHPILTALICTAPLLCGSGGGLVAAPSAQAAGQEQQLLDLAANFNGSESLERMLAALQRGNAPNTQDTAGNTPLLYLCEALEMDYRYRTEPHYAQAIDGAIAALLRRGADALHENKQGCNALFYMQSKPALLARLKEEKLLPKDLAVRIPYEPAALGRYMRLRVEQAECTTHSECKQYLARRYCMPAYDRAFSLLQQYLKAETGKKIPPNALEDTLAFLRLADVARAESYIDSLPLWEHGEHFLEEVPGMLLSALNQTHWRVKPGQLRCALKKLGSMLPRSAEEMIDCHAALPMSRILEMLYRQEGEKALPDIRRHISSRDADLAYSALRLLLQREGLPLPEPEGFARCFGCAEGAGTEGMTALQRRLYECVLADTAMRLNDFANVDANMLRRAKEAWTDMGLASQAKLLDAILTDEGITADAFALAAASNAYNELPAPSLRTVLARYILDCPETFAPQPTKPETE